ncbi:hypothetical protein FIU86_15380 [Roseovarius sp. THAF9]|uniref:hypothetical protein n=1 Tax=Roseovarius sp. THAF9 TaxID=2587847 RepID=UPI0012684428|nr:hypothetical protein [Roseovarius sp. THAF9]QFT94232.1 hypothetical protein FIU86_15380 [Roseovarius sp. THAF9]
MTEITANKKPRETYVVDPVAFFFALVGAPLAVAVGGFWALGIPVFAVVFGGPFYLAIGVPVLLWYLGRRPPEPWRIAGLALVSYGVPAGIFMLYLLVTGGQSAAQEFVIFAGFGLIFAPLWGGVFGIFYRNFRREFYARPI